MSGKSEVDLSAQVNGPEPDLFHCVVAALMRRLGQTDITLTEEELTPPVGMIADHQCGAVRFVISDARPPDSIIDKIEAARKVWERSHSKPPERLHLTPEEKDELRAECLSNSWFYSSGHDVHDSEYRGMLIVDSDQPGQFFRE